MSALYQPYIRLISAVYQPYNRRMSAVCQPWNGRMSAVCQPYIRRMSAVCQPYIRRMSAIPNLPICQAVKLSCKWVSSGEKEKVKIDTLHYILNQLIGSVEAVLTKTDTVVLQDYLWRTPQLGLRHLVTSWPDYTVSLGTQLSVHETAESLNML